MFNLKETISKILKKVYHNFLWQGLYVFLAKIAVSLIMSLPTKYYITEFVDNIKTTITIYPPLFIRLYSSFMVDPFRTISIGISIIIFTQLFVYLSLFFWAIASLIKNRRRALLSFIFITIATIASYVVFFNPCGGRSGGRGGVGPAVCVPNFNFFTINPLFILLFFQTIFILALFIITIKTKKEVEEIRRTNKFLEIILTIIAISIIFSIFSIIFQILSNFNLIRILLNFSLT